MATDEVFDLFHKYNRLVRRSLANPLTCTSCGQPVFQVLGADDTLVLRCYICNSDTVPGQRMIDDVRAVVREHFV